ncbi:MAG: manganese efflux pump MntP family protein [Verrucomicrobiota bacterium]
MTTWVVIGIACALAMDAFAVSVSSGIAIQKMHLRHALVIASFFGVFQAVMPVIGWFAGRHLAKFMDSMSVYLAGGLLIVIGAKVIYELHWTEKEAEERDPLNLWILFALAIATSLDAFAVGITLAALDASLYQAAALIGIITFAFSFAGTYIGDIFGHIFEDRIELLAGLFLIGLGLEIILSHIFF